MGELLKSDFVPMKVPSFHHELMGKLGMTGITVLKNGRYRKRYTGSKKSFVDINGNLVMNEPKKKGAPNLKRPPLTEKSEENKVTKEKKIRNKKYSIDKTEVRNRILAMINTERGKKELYFWTVTFPKDTPDSIAYKLYNTWLTTLRQKRWLREYIWIAERQQNGTVHFHIAIPHRLSVVAANRAMQTVLRGASLRGEINFSIYQCKRYNGVDIAKNRKTRKVTNFAVKKGARSLAHYLTKYVTKNNAEFSHLAWHNSRGYSSLYTGITFTRNEFRQSGFLYDMNRNCIIETEHFKFFGWMIEPPSAFIEHLYLLNSLIQERNNILSTLN